jgi:hypothetical protein
MRADTAAAFVDERSVETFRRRVGTLFPEPMRIAGMGDRWLRADLESAVAAAAGRAPADAADII